MPCLASLLRSAAALLAVAVAFGAAGCASSSADEADPVPETVVARDVGASELARELGLRVLGESADRVTLETIGGTRILLFPGTRVATVAGRMLQLQQPVTFTGGDAWIGADDATSIRQTWRTQIASGAALPSSPTSATPRVPIPARPSGASTPGRAPSTGPAAASDNRPTAAEVTQWSVPLRRKWQYIVVHHSASAAGSASMIDRWHKDRGMDGLGYDFVIGNGTGTGDGVVEVGYRWKQQLVGAHVRTSASTNHMNETGIGICLVGDFSRSRPSAAQMRALDRLCTFLVQYCGLPTSSLRLHGDLKSTECPGKNFPRDFAIRLPGGASRTVASHHDDDHASR